MNRDPGTPGNRPPLPYASAGNLIKEIRARTGMSQLTAAYEVLGTSNISTYSHLETGERRVTKETIEKLFRGMGASLDERAELYRLADRGEPDRIPCCRDALGDPPGLSELMEDLRMQVWKNPYPTYLLSGAFEALEMNQPYREIAEAFPVPKGHEIADPLKYPIGFVLLYPDAENVFIEWMRNWVPAMLSYLKAGIELNPNDPVIAMTADAVLSQRRLRSAYDQVPADLDALSHHRVDRLVRVRQPDRPEQIMGMRVRMYGVPLLRREAFSMLHVFPYTVSGESAS